MNKFFESLPGGTQRSRVLGMFIFYVLPSTLLPWPYEIAIRVVATFLEDETHPCSACA